MFPDIAYNHPLAIVSILQQLYASEVIAAEQYWSHWTRVKGPHSVAIQAMLDEHAREERTHADMLRKRIHDLGSPLDNRLAQLLELNGLITPEAPDVVHETALSAILLADMVAEQRAVESYTRAIDIVRDLDPVTSLVLTQILKDEYEHLQELRNLLARED